MSFRVQWSASGLDRLIEILDFILAVDGLPDWDQGRSRTVHYIDWDHPENNTFTAINQ